MNTVGRGPGVSEAGRRAPPTFVQAHVNQRIQDCACLGGALARCNVTLAASLITSPRDSSVVSSPLAPARSPG